MEIKEISETSVEHASSLIRTAEELESRHRSIARVWHGDHEVLKD